MKQLSPYLSPIHCIIQINEILNDFIMKKLTGINKVSDNRWLHLSIILWSHVCVIKKCGSQIAETNFRC